MDKYTAEMALFEIWGAIQSAKCDFDGMYKVKSIARRCMEKAGLLKEGKMGNG